MSAGQSSEPLEHCLRAVLRFPLLAAAVFAHCPQYFGCARAYERTDSNPAPSLVRVFDKLAHGEGSEHSSDSQKMGCWITGCANRRMRAAERLPWTRDVRVDALRKEWCGSWLHFASHVMQRDDFGQDEKKGRSSLTAP